MKSSQLNFVIFSSISILFFLSACGQAQNDDTQDQDNNPLSIDVETNSSTAKTFVGFLQATLNTVGKGSLIVQSYLEESNAMSQKPGAISTSVPRSKPVSVDDFDVLLPHDLSKVSRCVQCKNKLSPRAETTINLEQELDLLIAEYKATIAKLAPDPSLALTLEGVEQTEKGIVIDGDILINPKTLAGAIKIEILNAEARGDDVDAVVAELESVVATLFPDSPSDSEGNNKLSNRGMYTRNDKFWENGIVYYYWDGMSNVHKEAMRVAMTDWNVRTGGAVQFKDYNKQSSWHKFLTSTGVRGAVNFEDSRDGLSATTTGSATVGYIGSHLTELSLWTDLVDDVENNRMQLHRTTRHELGHVLGLRHEHKRYDRDSWVIVPDALVDKSTDSRVKGTKIIWVNKVIKKGWLKIGYNIPRVVGKQYSYLKTAYDCESIMHYNNFITRRPCQSYLAGRLIRNFEISDLDVVSIQAMY
ncbi:MAG: M12 family metallopeptidase [Gammaproteobacteria bacterium]|nr:M12 family metallopeptidase [Gammaproteobacteria bacterium]